MANKNGANVVQDAGFSTDERLALGLECVNRLLEESRRPPLLDWAGVWEEKLTGRIALCIAKSDVAELRSLELLLAEHERDRPGIFGAQ